MSSIINLMYFDYEDTFFYIDILKLDPAYFNDFLEFYGDVIDGANTLNPNKNIGVTYTGPVPPAVGAGVVGTAEYGNVGDPIGYYTKETGEGAFPFTQSISLNNITAENVLTNFDAGTTYNFDMEVQETDYAFSALGSALETWQDVIDLVTSNTPATAEYYPTTRDNRPYIRFTSHVEGRENSTGEDGSSVSAIKSQINMRIVANVVVPDSEKYTYLSYAYKDIGMPEPNAASILTLVPSNDDTVFQFAVGRRKNLTVRGFQARTYQDLVDTINKFEGVNCLYRIDAANGAKTRKHVVTLYVPLPKSPKISDVTVSTDDGTDAAVITQKSMVRATLSAYASSTNLISIEDFSGLTTNSKILHKLGNSIYGGYTLLSVVQNSKRSNGSFWTEVISIQSSQITSQEVSSKVLEQDELIKAIDAQIDATPDMTEDTKRKMSIDLGSILKYGAILSGGKASIKSALIQAAIGQIAGVIGKYFPRDAVDLPDVDPADAIAVQADIVDDGYADGAIDPVTGEVNPELLTPAQKSKLVVPDRTTVE